MLFKFHICYDWQKNPRTEKGGDGDAQRKSEKVDTESNGRSRQSNGRSSPEVVGSIPTEVKRCFLRLVWFPVSLYLG